MLNFNDIFVDDTKYGMKIPKEKYLSVGLYPVIDQSKEQIAGYTDESEGIYCDVPAIIFGDHTRIIKYIDVPFFLGADGTKLLKIKDNTAFNCKYLYYALSNAKIPNTGYNRHFKWLKELSFNIPSIEKQREIADLMDIIVNLENLRKKQLEKLELFVKSRFIEMFGDPYYNPKGWKSDYLGNYMTTLTDFSANGSYEILDSNVVMYDEPNYAIMVRTTDLEKGDLTGELKYIDEKAYNLLSKSKLYGGELIMSKIGSAGKIYLMPFINKPASLGRNAFMFRFNECINIVFLYTLLNTDYGTNMIQQHVRGAVTKTITKESTRKLLIYVPPIELQNQFADFVAQVDKSKLAIQQSLYELETLKKSLMQQYFG